MISNHMPVYFWFVFCLFLSLAVFLFLLLFWQWNLQEFLYLPTISYPRNKWNLLKFLWNTYKKNVFRNDLLQVNYPKKYPLNSMLLRSDLKKDISWMSKSTFTCYNIIDWKLIPFNYFITIKLNVLFVCIIICY